LQTRPQRHAIGQFQTYSRSVGIRWSRRVHNEAIAALNIFNERELSKEFLFYCLCFFDWVKVAENDVKLKG